MCSLVSKVDLEKARVCPTRKRERKEATIQAGFPIQMIKHSQSSFGSRPHEQVSGLSWIEENQIQLLGFYHLHPGVKVFLSDPDRNALPNLDLFLLVWSIWTCTKKCLSIAA
jgi:proteasome lid subunit RPN8/RPN11